MATGGGFVLPAVIADQGDKAAERFFAWTHAKGLSLPAIKSYHVSAYLAELLDSIPLKIGPAPKDGDPDNPLCRSIDRHR